MRKTRRVNPENLPTKCLISKILVIIEVREISDNILDQKQTSIIVM